MMPMRTLILPMIVTLLGVPYGSAIAELAVVDGEKQSREVGGSQLQEFDVLLGGQTNLLAPTIGNSPGNRYSGFLNMRYRSLQEPIEKGFDVRIYVNDLSLVEYSVKNAYFQIHQDSWVFNFGRAELHWSRLDASWGLGNINNRIRFDYFNVEQEGLIGLHSKYEFENKVEISVFSSLIYIPELDQTRKVSDSDKKITCQGMWCTPPISEREVNGRLLPIIYDVEYPPAPEVVNQPSLGAKVDLPLSQTISLSTFFLRKPENRFAIAADVSVKEDFTALNVKIVPKVYKHDLRGGELKYVPHANITLFASYLNVRRLAAKVSSYADIEYLGFVGNKQEESFSSIGLDVQTTYISIRSSYLRQTQGVVSESTLMSHYSPWIDALKISMISSLGTNISANFDAKYDFKSLDRLLCFDLGYRLSNRYEIHLGVKSIGTPENQQSYWSKFEDNDSVYSSIQMML